MTEYRIEHNPDAWYAKFFSRTSASLGFERRRGGITAAHVRG